MEGKQTVIFEPLKKLYQRKVVENIKEQKLLNDDTIGYGSSLFSI